MILFTIIELEEAVEIETKRCIKICEDKREQALDKFGLLPPVAYWNGRAKCADEISEEIREDKIEQNY